MPSQTAWEVESETPSVTSSQPSSGWEVESETPSKSLPVGAEKTGLPPVPSPPIPAGLAPDRRVKPDTSMGGTHRPTPQAQVTTPLAATKYFGKAALEIARQPAPILPMAQETGLLPKEPNSIGTEIGTSVAKAVGGLSSPESIALMTGAEFAGMGLELGANSAKIVKALENVPHPEIVLKSVAMAAKNAIPVSFIANQLKASYDSAKQGEVGDAVVNALFAVAGILGVKGSAEKTSAQFPPKPTAEAKATATEVGGIATPDVTPEQAQAAATQLQAGGQRLAARAWSNLDRSRPVEITVNGQQYYLKPPVTTKTGTYNELVDAQGNTAVGGSAEVVRGWINQRGGNVGGLVSKTTPTLGPAGVAMAPAETLAAVPTKSPAAQTQAVEVGSVYELPTGKVTVTKSGAGKVDFTRELPDGTLVKQSRPASIFNRMVTGAAPVQPGLTDAAQTPQSSANLATNAPPESAIAPQTPAESRWEVESETPSKPVPASTQEAAPPTSPIKEVIPKPAVAEQVGAPGSTEKVPRGWEQVAGVPYESHASLSLSDAELRSRAKASPLPLPETSGEAGEYARAPWDIVSRLIPETAKKVTRIEPLDANSPHNATINPQTGVLKIKPGVTAETMWHELVHLDQPEAAGGRLSLAPDYFNSLEAAARDSGAPGLLKRFSAMIPLDEGFAKAGNNITEKSKTPSIADLLGSARRTYSVGGESMEAEDPRAQIILKSLSPEDQASIEALMGDAKSPSVLASGFDHVVIDLGNGKVMRLGKLPGHEVESPLIAKPSLSKTVGKVGVEIYPKLETTGITQADVNKVQEKLASEGLVWDDAATDNLGRDANGDLQIIDGRVSKEKANVESPAPAGVPVGHLGSEVLPLSQDLGVGVPRPAGPAKPGVPEVPQADRNQAGQEEGVEAPARNPEVSHGWEIESEKPVQAGPTKPAVAFRMKGPELKALADKGDTGAQAEIDRRAGKRGEPVKPETKASVVQSKEVKPETKTPPAVQKVTQGKIVADVLRKGADALQNQIDAKRNSGIFQQNPTRRRNEMAEGITKDADRLERIQKGLRTLADLHESGHVPAIISGVKSRSAFESLLPSYHEHGPERGTRREARFPSAYISSYPAKEIIEKIQGTKGNAEGKFVVLKAQRDGARITEKEIPFVEAAIDGAEKKGFNGKSLRESIATAKRLYNIGINEGNFKSAVDAVEALGVKKREPTAEEKIAKAERDLAIGSKIEGFFPTPKPLAREMVQKADIRSGMTVLEPSAGNGNIADAIREEGTEPDVIEPYSTLRGILEQKKHKLIGSDFLEEEGKYDRIVMNPPFEKRQDVDHVLHAYEILKPGGRVVAIMSEGTFFGSDKKATAFREWLDEHNGTEEKLPEGSFTGKDAMRQTGVAARMVVIDKPVEKAAVKYVGDKPEVGNGKSPLEKANAARSEKLLDKKIGTRDHGVLTYRELVDKVLEDGGHLDSADVADEAERNAIQKKYDLMNQGFNVPWGNSSHPKTIEAQALKDKLAGKITKTEYRLYRPGENDGWSVIPKTVYDYGKLVEGNRFKSAMQAIVTKKISKLGEATPTQAEEPKKQKEQEKPSAERFDEIHKEIEKAYKNPMYTSQAHEGSQFRDKVLDMESEREFHRPAAVERAQREIDQQNGKGPAQKQLPADVEQKFSDEFKEKIEQAKKQQYLEANEAEVRKTAEQLTQPPGDGNGARVGKREAIIHRKVETVGRGKSQEKVSRYTAIVSDPRHASETQTFNDLKDAAYWATDLLYGLGRPGGKFERFSGYGGSHVKTLMNTGELIGVPNMGMAASDAAAKAIGHPELAGDIYHNAMSGGWGRVSRATTFTDVARMYADSLPRNETPLMDRGESKTRYMGASPDENLLLTERLPNKGSSSWDFQLEGYERTAKGMMDAMKPIRSRIATAKLLNGGSTARIEESEKHFDGYKKAIEKNLEYVKEQAKVETAKELTDLNPQVRELAQAYAKYGTAGFPEQGKQRVEQAASRYAKLEGLKSSAWPEVMESLGVKQEKPPELIPIPTGKDKLVKTEVEAIKQVDLSRPDPRISFDALERFQKRGWANESGELTDTGKNAVYTLRQDTEKQASGKPISEYVVSSKTPTTDRSLVNKVDGEVWHTNGHGAWKGEPPKGWPAVDPNSAQPDIKRVLPEEKGEEIKPIGFYTTQGRNGPLTYIVFDNGVTIDSVLYDYTVKRFSPTKWTRITGALSKANAVQVWDKEGKRIAVIMPIRSEGVPDGLKGKIRERTNEEPERESRGQEELFDPNTVIRTAYRNGILWVNSAGMKKLAEVFGSDAANGMYIPSGKASGLLLRVPPELRPGVTAALKAGPSITVVRMNTGESISQSKAKARHELFHATETWGGEGRAADLLEHPLAQRASALLAGGGYDAGNQALMFSEIGAHLASGPVGWEAMGLDENEAEELFARYLELLDDKTVSNLNRVTPLLKRELNAERAIRREQTELGQSGSAEDSETEGGAEQEQEGLPPGVSEDVQPGQGTRPTGAGKVKESKLAQGVEEKAIANGLTQGFEGRPEYQTVNVQDQAKRAAELLKNDPKQAIEIAMGRELPPNGLLPESVFVAVENYATANKDVALLRDLATSSTLSMEATGMGQRIRMLGERNPNSAVRAMQEVSDAREAAAKKKYGPKAKEKVKAEIKVSIKKANPKKHDWASFISSIACD